MKIRLDVVQAKFFFVKHDKRVWLLKSESMKLKPNSFLLNVPLKQLSERFRDHSDVWAFKWFDASGISPMCGRDVMFGKQNNMVKGRFGC